MRSPTPQTPSPQNASPLNPLPMIVWIIVLPMIAMEIVLSAGEAGLIGGPAGLGWRLEAVQRFAFVPEYLRQMLGARQFPLDGVMRVVSYPLVSLAPSQTLFVVVITLALGKFVGEVFRWPAILGLFLAGVVGGAVIYGLLPQAQMPLVGGYPGVYGLIGGFTYVLWRRSRIMGTSQLAAFRLIGFLLALRIVFAVGPVLFYGSAAGTGLDWVAELAGFAVGFLLSFVVIPGGWQALRARLRGGR